MIKSHTRASYSNIACNFSESVLKSHNLQKTNRFGNSKSFVYLFLSADTFANLRLTGGADLININQSVPVKNDSESSPATMPTVFLLDASLSMERMVDNSSTNGEDNCGSNGNMDSGGGDSLLDLSRLGVSLLLEHFELNLRMEQAALISFGSRCEVLAGFSRDFSDLRSRLALIAGSGSTLFAPALHTAVSLISEATGGSSASSSSSPSPGSPRFDLVVVTDGGMGRGPDSIRPGGYLDRLGPLGFRGRITVVCLCHPDDPAADGTKAAYEKIIGLTGLQGEVIVSDCAPTR